MTTPASPTDDTTGKTPSADAAATATAAQAEGQAQDAKLQADPSTASPQDANDRPKSLLDAVESALEFGQKRADDVSSDVGKKDQAADGQQSDLAVKPEGEAEGDDDPPPFHDHPRWKQLVAERKELSDKVAQFEPAATQFSEITTFMGANGLAAEDVQEGFRIMALMRRDPAKAREALQQHLGLIEEFLGEKLPKDLQEKVEGGFVDEDTARETARLRMQSQANVEAAQARAAADSRGVEQRAIAEAATAVTEWERGWQANDPDYPKKAELVHDQVAALMMREGRPTTRAKALDMAQRAKTVVERRLSGFAPRPQPSRVVPSGAGPAGKTTPKPRTLAEAVDAALEQSAA